MKGEWCYFKSYLSPDMCNKIIEDAQSIIPQDASLGVYGEESNNDVRRSKIRFVSKDDWRFSYLFDILWKTALQANDDFFNIHISKLDFIQIAEYDSAYQGEYKDHHDVFWLNDDPFYHRKLTAVIQLSDPATYEGGNLELSGTKFSPPADELREQGTIIYFPSLVVHRACPVTTGVRYSVAAWFDGPKWR